MQLKNELLKMNLSHSIMLLSQDDCALLDYSFFLAKLILCENKSACNNCLQCHKINHQNHADFLVYPREKEVISVDEILKLVENVSIMPFEAEKKVYVLNNFSACSTLVQNKMLKTLEEPPKNAVFILNVTNEAKVLPTIKSRCQKIFVPKFSDEEIFESLNKFELSNELKKKITIFCDGVMSRAHKFAQMQKFEEILNFSVDLWKNLRNSSQILYYANKVFFEKEDFSTFLYLYNLILREVVYAKLGKTQMIKNQDSKQLFESVAKDFSLSALVEISKLLPEYFEKLEKNCNVALCSDNFLTKVLERRAKCQ